MSEVKRGGNANGAAKPAFLSHLDPAGRFPDREMSKFTHWAAYGSALSCFLTEVIIMSGLTKYRTRPISPKQQEFARALGWFSLGLGAAELLIPNALARLIGLKRRHKTLFRIFGLRELAAGVGILSESKYPSWVRSRVAGDALDLACLGLALASPSNKQSRLAAATAAVVGVTVLDIICSEEMTRTRMKGGGNGVSLGKNTVQSVVTINRPAEDLYQFWRNFENLPQIMYHLESVHVTSEKRSHWLAKGPGGKTIKWQAEITEDRPNESISWRTLPGSDVDHTGTVRFEPATGGRGTVVRVEMTYKSPAGLFGAAVAKLMGREPGQEVHDSLRYFRQIMETGVIPTTVGQSTGRPSSTSKKFDYAMPRPNPTEGESVFAN